MTTTLTNGCCRLMGERGSGSRSNCSAISPRLVVVVVAIAFSGSGREGSPTELAYGKRGDGATPYLATLSHSAVLALELNPVKELPDIHPDTDFRPGQNYCPSPEHNMQIFLSYVDAYFGKTPGSRKEP